MPRGDAASLDWHRVARVHHAPGRDYARLFAADVGARHGFASRVLTDADLRVHRDPDRNDRKRPVGATRADGPGGPIARSDERRDANNRGERSIARVESETAGVGLGVDGACADRSVSLFVEFHSVAADQENPLARNSLRARFGERNPHPQALTAAFSGAKARWMRQRRNAVAAPAGIASHQPASRTVFGPNVSKPRIRAPARCWFSRCRPHVPKTAMTIGARIAPATAQ